MPHRKRPYFKQKPTLYFDENFPLDVIESLSCHSRWKKKYKFVYATKIGNKGKSDNFHLSYCKNKKYTLVTFDADFGDDSEFPIDKIPGIIVVKVSKNNSQGIISRLGSLLDFLNQIPLPKMFLGDSKFIVSSEGCVIRARDSETRELKSIHIIAGETTIAKIRQHFSY